MNVSDRLRTAAALRVPVFEAGAGRLAKIAALEDHTLLSAFVAGDLHEERLGAYERMEPLKREWDGLTGWEAHTRSKTDVAANDAKRRLRPDLHAQIADLGWTIRRLSEEIARLAADSDRVSRAYTMLTGP